MHDSLAFGLYSGIVLVICSYLSKNRDVMLQHKKNAARLGQAVEQLSIANVGFQNFAKGVEEETLTSERQRVSREIHDSVGYALTNLTMMMEAAMDIENKDSTKLRELIWKAKNQSEEALHETHRAVRTLRSIEIKHERGISSIQRLINNFEKATGVTVEVEYCNLPQLLGERYDEILYRTIQEGLTNAFRHGKADTVRIIFWRDDAQIKVWIRDNGKGSGIIQEGIGLSGMRERISSLGGEVEAKNTFQGFELAIWFPWNSRKRGEKYEFRTTNIG